MEPGFVRTAMTETAAEHGWGPVKQGLATGLDTPVELAASLALSLAAGDVLPLSGRFFCVGDDVEEKRQRADEIVQNDLYTLRLAALPTQPLVPWARKIGWYKS